MAGDSPSLPAQPTPLGQAQTETGSATLSFLFPLFKDLLLLIPSQQGVPIPPFCRAGSPEIKGKSLSRGEPKSSDPK